MARILNLIFILTIFGLWSCNPDDSTPTIPTEEKKYPVSATVQDQIFYANDINQSIEDNIGWVMDAYDGDNVITIGTSWPLDAGNYTLSTWDPFNNQRFFASYTSLSKEYRTLDNSGTLTIQTIRIENNTVVELIGTFEFKGYSAAGEEIIIQSGRLNYQK